MENIIITYSGFILALLSAVVALIQFMAKKKLELDKINLQKNISDESNKQRIRYETYKEYLSKLDEISSNLMKNISGEEMQSGIAEMFEGILQNPNDQQPIKEYFGKMNKFFSGWAREQARNLEELNGLRLVCSKEILNLLDDYESMVKSYINDVSEAMKNPNIFLKPDLNSPQILNQKTNYQKMLETRVLIEKAMRKDIGVE
jgi:hypothetical protein